MDGLGIIILAAGKGKRMGGVYPKVLLKLGGRFLIDYVIRTALSLNPSRIVVVVGFAKEQVMEYLKSYEAIEPGYRQGLSGASEGSKQAVKLHYSFQEQQLGTGHAVRQTEKLFKEFNGTIVLLNGDVPLISTSTLQELLANHTKTGAGATVLTAHYENPGGYGRIVRDAAGNLLRIVEEEDAADKEKQISEINTGTFVFRAEHLFAHLSELKRDNAQTEYYVTDLIRILRKHGIAVAAWRTAHPEETYGVNTPEQLEALQSILMRT